MKTADKENEFILVTDKNFNEQAYLASNPDVALAIKEGHVESGKIHFEQAGRKEKRKMRVSDLLNNLPKRYSLLYTLFTFIAKARDSFWGRLQRGLEYAFIGNKSHADETHTKRKQIAQEYITGVGIEIGALHNPLPVPENATVRYVDRLSVAHLRQQYPELNQLPLVNVDIVTDGETLERIENASQDFVVANHFLEHCQNPLLAIENMFRVLKQNGILYMAIPDKRYTFDSARPLTPYQHLVNDYAKGGEVSRKHHFEEWVKIVNNVSDKDEATRQVQHLMSTDFSIHFHVWTQIEMMELVLNLKKKFQFEIELICRNNIHEVIFILRKS